MKTEIKNLRAHRSFVKGIVICVLISLIAPDLVKAEIVVRSSNMSENEFQAIAMARGETPASEALTNENQRRISAELLELYRLRLVDAQSEWISRTSSGSHDTPAIDRFLTLAYEADWAEAERKGFATFFARKLEVSQNSAGAQRELRAYLGDSLSEAEKQEWKISSHPSPEDWRAVSSLEAPLPSDITHVLLNGRVLDRAIFLKTKLPPHSQRVTLISNLYQPTTIILKGDEIAWPEVSRSPWSHDGCSVNPRRAFDSDIKVSVLSETPCTSVESARLTTSHDTMIEKFGIDRKPGLPRPVEKSEKAFYEKSWFWWSLAGAVALGAVVAIERSQNPSSVRPTTRQGW